MSTCFHIPLPARSDFAARLFRLSALSVVALLCSACVATSPSPQPLVREPSPCSECVHRTPPAQTATSGATAPTQPQPSPAPPQGPGFEEVRYIQPGNISGLDWSPTDNLLAMTLFAGSLEDASRLVVYDGASGNELCRIPFEYGHGLAFSSDGAVIASPHPTKRMVQLFDAMNIVALDSMECAPADYGCGGGVHVASLPYERRFLTTTFPDGGSIFEWDATHGEFIRSLPRTDDTILRIATSPTGDWFITDVADPATGEGTVIVWEYPSAEKKCSWSGKSSAPIGPQNMAAVATSQEIIIYNVEPCQPAYSLNGKQRDVSADPSGRVLAAMTTDFQLTLYDLQTQQPGPTGKVSSSSSSHRLVRMAFNRDGSLLAIAQDSDLRILRILP